jgi:transposase
VDRLIERCCGLDVHKATVTACVRVPDRRGNRAELLAEYSTMTADLLALSDWLRGVGVTHVAMEATGVYWKPGYYLLEEDFELLLVNAAHIKHVPGRKTDVQDAQWIAQLLEHGLLRGSFVPPREIRELRDLTRYRKSLIRERQREANRLHKLLEDANIKLASVATDVLGVSGRAMLGALLSGESDPEVLAELARGRLRKKLPALREALHGRFSGHHALLLSHILAHLDYLEEAIAQLSQEIERRLAPFQRELELLRSIPGVERRTAEAMLAELGPDRARFPSHRHAASWAGICPGSEESAGKRKSGRTRKGNRWLREVLIESGLAASRTKDTYPRAHYVRVKRRRGHKRATVSTGHSILVSAYHVLKQGVPCHELGSDYLDRRDDPERLVRRLVGQLERLGQHVTVETAAAT